MSIVEQLRDHLLACGITRAEIARRSLGTLSESLLCSFAKGRTTLSFRRADILANVIGLQFTQTQK
jgi:hypothetical protein